jgi:hypothetical protein
MKCGGNVAESHRDSTNSNEKDLPCWSSTTFNTSC